jgi:hypothetical protein
MDNETEYRLQHYTIVTKELEVKPLTFNRGQWKLWRAIKSQEDCGKPVRVILLKARQWGGSTLTAAYILDKVIRISNAYGFVLSYDYDSADTLFGMYETAYDNYPEELNKPTRKKAAARHWRFEKQNSQIKVGTAKKKETGRSKTLHYLHISEVALFQHTEAVMQSLMNSVPRGHGGTGVILESTAKGMNNYFHKQWKKTNIIPRISTYIPVFVAWWEIEKYREEFYNSSERLAFSQDLNEEEAIIQRIYNVDLEQLYWRRITLENECNGSTDAFHEEYPSNAEEAFLTSGQCRFSTMVVDKWDKEEEQAQMVVKPSRHSFDPEGEIVVNPFGELFIYETPEPCSSQGIPREYVMCVDVSENKTISEDGKDHDDSVIHILKRGNMAVDTPSMFKVLDQVAVWAGKVEPYDLAAMCYHLGMWYNRALAAIESNMSGGTVNHVLHHVHNYPFMYFKEILDKMTVTAGKTLGYYTSSTTRDPMLDSLAQMVKEESIRIRHRETLSQMMSFVLKKNRKYEADAGCKDDHVMALAIGVQVNMRYRDFKAPKDSILQGDEWNLKMSEVRRRVHGKPTRDKWYKQKTKTIKLPPSYTPIMK